MRKATKQTRTTEPHKVPAPARILASARRLFAELGYERTTVRLIAADAHIHPSLVMRYFGSKEKLFTSSSKFDLAIPSFLEVPAKKRGRAIVQYFFERWEGDDSGDELPALLRMSVTHPDGRAKVIQIFAGQVQPALALNSSSKDVQLSVAMIATQLVGIAFLRYVLKLPAFVNLPKEAIVEEASAAVQRYLDGPAVRTSTSTKPNGRRAR
jgi:AcrR family transcriptional regulator